jgi:hypothetical protein
MDEPDVGCRKKAVGVKMDGKLAVGCGPVERKKEQNEVRDHTKLDVFHVADQLVLTVYVKTRAFPKDEMFCLTSQMRRCPFRRILLKGVHGIQNRIICIFWTWPMARHEKFSIKFPWPNVWGI